MNEITRKLTSDYDAVKNPDGYKPTSVPSALKVIYGQMKNQLEESKMTEQNRKVSTENILIKNRIVDIYISCENEKRAIDWYTNVLGLESLVMENGIRLLLMEWGENHKAINESAVFSLQSPDIYKAHTELKARGAVIKEEVTQYGANSYGFHVIDSEGNAILIIDKAS